MKMKKIYYMLIVIILIIGISSQIFADNELPYLRMGVGAKALSMGSAFTAVSNNVTATYWNPAGLANIDCIEIGSMFSANMGLDREHNYVGVARKFGFGTIALSWINAGWRDFQGDQGDYDIMNNNISVSYGTKLLETFKIGISAKAYTQDIVDETENGFGFDTGILYDLHPRISIGFMVRDFVSSFGDDDVPYQANFGVAVRPFDFLRKNLQLINGFTISGDVKKERDESDLKIGLGLEYALNLKTISNIDVDTALRFGSNDGHFTAGLGIGFKMLEFNYAFTTDTSEDEIFEDSHRLSLLMRFYYNL